MDERIKQKKTTCALYNDNYQNWKRYPIQKAQEQMLVGMSDYEEETEYVQTTISL